jgi:GNAT superfamily N-acetyltransferase
MIAIAPFRPEHHEGVLLVVLPIQQQEFGIPITLAEQPDLMDIPGFCQQRKGNFWVALAGAEVVGTIALLDLGGGLGVLRKMFVKKAWRGKDVAQGLLETLLAWASNWGFREIYLGTTASFLAAHRFYEKTGFQEIRAEELPAAFPRVSFDSKFYRLAL